MCKIKKGENTMSIEFMLGYIAGLVVMGVIALIIDIKH